MSKKLTLIFAGLLSLSAISFAQEEIRVSGKIDNIDTDKLYLTITADNTVREDSIEVKKGKFKYAFTSGSFSAIQIYPRFMANVAPDKFKEVTASAFTIYGMPGDQLKVTGSRLSYLIDYEVTGNSANDDFVKMAKAINPVYDEKLVIDFNDQLEQYYSATGAMFEPGANSKDQQEEMNRLKSDFMEANPQSYYTMYEMAFSSDKEKLISYMDKLDEEASHPYFYKLLQARRQSFDVGNEGSKAPNILTSDIYKEPFNLEDLQGKIVVIDFWGTWCGPCIMGLPDMKEHYEKYKGKIEYVSIACNEKNGVEGVIKMVKKKEMVWPQIMNGEDLFNYSKMYGVTGFPTKFVLDQEGNVLQKFVGEGSGFYTYLDELFK
ncbi:MAG: redoxin domain-containing protein [Ekhidna sp.]|nr:redoxin domain-containing protein [Ekhidna sp.]